jgi:2'-5' RNA ligase
MFIALPIPPAVADTVAEAIEPWRDAFPSVRWIPPERWHVTIAFLGATRPELVTWVREQLGMVAGATRAFETRVVGLGSFPSARRAKVLWAGLDEGAGRLSGLAEGVRAALAGGLALEPRPFRPHLTIARCDPPLNLPAGYAATDLESRPFAVDVIELMQSHQGGPIPRYGVLARFPLAHEVP